MSVGTQWGDDPHVGDEGMEERVPPQEASGAWGCQGSLPRRGSRLAGWGFRGAGVCIQEAECVGVTGEADSVS